MPIRKENRHLYPPPKKWAALRARVMKRARDACECRGECGHAHEVVDAASRSRGLRCGAPHGLRIFRALDNVALWLEAPAGLWVDGFSRKVTTVVLTTAHLDRDPRNNGMRNLKAMCQLCHLAYDREQHTKNARETRRSRKAVGDLPGMEMGR